MTSELITTIVNWRDAKTCSPPVSGYYVVICGFEENDEFVPSYTTVLLYSKTYNMFNVKDDDMTTDTAINSVMYWCYTDELFNQLSRRKNETQ